MKHLKIAFISSLVLLLFAGCSKMEFEPESQNVSDKAALYSDDNSVLKGMNTKNGEDKFIPIKGIFTVSVYNRHPVEFDPPTLGQEVKGSGKMSHLGNTRVYMEQIWYPPSLPPPGPPWTGTGKGNITFTAANGDLLYATYTAESDHPVGKPATVIYYCKVNGNLSTGRFEDAKGSFIWNGTYEPATNIGHGIVSNGRIMY